MKKTLLAVCVLSLALGTKAFAADTYTGSFVESLNKKIDAAASPVVNKEKALQAKQLEAQNLKQNQLDAQKRELAARQKAQQDLINKKKQQVQSQKDMLKNEKENLKSIFSVN